MFVSFAFDHKCPLLMFTLVNKNVKDLETAFLCETLRRRIPLKHFPTSIQAAVGVPLSPDLKK